MEGKKLTAETARRLKELREQKGISHKYLSETLKEQYNIHASKGTLIAYEVADENHSQSNSFRGMSIERLFYLSQFYNVSADYILGLTDDKSQKPIAMDELGLSGEAVTELKEIKRSSHSEEDRAFLGLLSKIIVDCSPVALREAYINYCAFREMYEKREDMRKQDISVLCRQAGLTVGDMVSPESLGYSFDNYVDYIYSQMKRYEFEILFHVSAALSR